MSAAVAAAALAAILTASASSQETPSPRSCARDPRQGIRNVEIKVVGPVVRPRRIAPPADAPPQDPLPALERIVNVAKQVIELIDTVKERLRPIVDVRTDYATALPSGITNWDQLSGWKPPQGTAYELKAVNGFGTEVVKVRYNVLRMHGGSYKGRGLYLTAVTVEPVQMHVAAGYDLKFWAQVPPSSVINAGSTESPLAGMLMTVRWRIHTPLKDAQGAGLYYLQGDGLFQEVGGPFKKKYARDVAKSLAGALEYAPLL